MMRYLLPLIQKRTNTQWGLVAHSEVTLGYDLHATHDSPGRATMVKGGGNVAEGD